MNRVKSDLGKAKQLLRERKEQLSEHEQSEELAEVRVRNMRELLEDLKNRIDGTSGRGPDADEEVLMQLPGFFR